ncbi:TetR/AcrR family transcriptional regulator [Actinomadura kijaniata]|uniref:AcrR family transcriptional regulator n=1 Tax=Actinomadura namibiensis TaxID=182080 RepID=A0A7W3LXF3_ACTNM|nr:TetR/AcrR family transcriptional regulator [Actinomadura namibiensis]MBA8956019.1 AcrR family transcriptional regulator [Actinomadura namibiensis]
MARRTRGVGAEHEERRGQIADAVLAVVAERGLAAVSLTTVAARAGVSAGRVQHYFPTRQRLVEAAFDRANARSSARISALVGPHPEGVPARRVLTVVLTELVPHDEESRLHLRVRQAFTALALADESIAARLRADYAVLHDRIAALLARDERVDAADPHAVAVRLVGLAEALAYYTLIGVSTPEDARRQVLTAIGQVYGGPVTE